MVETRGPLRSFVFVGLKGGARSKLSLAGQKEAISMMESGGKTQSEVAEFFNVHRSTISRLVSERRVLERKANGESFGRTAQYFSSPLGS